MIHLGIDLGTSNTLAAYVEDGNPKIYEFGKHTMVPSIVYIEELGGYECIGDEALEKWADPEYDLKNSFRRWKLDMGEGKIIRHLEIGNAKVPITPECLTTKMVEYVVNQIVRGTGGQEVGSVLVTVPHGWRRENPEKCQMTRKAAAEAICQGAKVRVQEMTVSEPVAAAAYWIWAMRNDSRGNHATDLEGRTILVCDIGGGTFDLSLVTVGAPKKPHVVVQAANNNYAGDYVDALIVAEVCRTFNSEFKTTYPETADDVLKNLDSESYPCLRLWFKQGNKDWKEKISKYITSRPDLRNIRPVTGSFDDGQHTLRFSMTVEEFTRCFKPFYDNGCDLLRSLLSKLPQDLLPTAIVFSGGGSKIPFIREQIVEPILVEVMQSQEKAMACLQRITVNPDKIDRSIVLGAALIANGDVQVEEKLLSDIGIMGTLPNVIAKMLNIPDCADVLITPILKQGSSLPVRVSSQVFGIPHMVEGGSTLQVQVVVDDDADDPFIQDWEITIPPKKGPGTKQRSLEWVMAADTDGVLTLTLKPAQGEETTFEGRFERKSARRGRIVFGAGARGQDVTFYRASPEQIKKAWEESNRPAQKKGGKK